MSYRSLDPDKIVETARTLHRRIEERFPSAGLAGVCRELASIAERAAQQATWIARPIVSLRIAAGILLALISVGLVATLLRLRAPARAMNVLEFIQVLEAGINDIVLIGLAAFFLATLERRIKRRRALKALHELRSIAHIVDMHQLTKDPGHLLLPPTDTASSPQRTLTREHLARYLDYCSEMLSVTGKIAALYVQSFDDPVVLASVNEVEGLTTGLARKIWQKLMILESAGRVPPLALGGA